MLKAEAVVSAFLCGSLGCLTKVYGLFTLFLLAGGGFQAILNLTNEVLIINEYI